MPSLAKFDAAEHPRDPGGRFSDTGHAPSLRQASLAEASPGPQRRSLTRGEIWQRVGSKIAEIPASYTGSNTRETPADGFSAFNYRWNQPKSVPPAQHARTLRALKQVIIDQRAPAIEKAKVTRQQVAVHGAADHYTLKRRTGDLILDPNTPRHAVNRAYNHAAMLALHDFGVLDYGPFKMSDRLKEDMTPLVPFMRFIRRRLNNTFSLAAPNQRGPYRDEFGQVLEQKKRGQLTGKSRMRMRPNQEFVKMETPMAEPLEKGLFRAILQHSGDLIHQPTAVGKVPAFSQIKRSLVRASMLGRERAIAVDETGNVLHNVLGGRDRVSLPDDAPGTQSALVYHNHPSEGTAVPSPSDIGHSKQNNVRGVIIAPHSRTVSHFTPEVARVRGPKTATIRFDPNDWFALTNTHQRLLRKPSALGHAARSMRTWLDTHREKVLVGTLYGTSLAATAPMILSGMRIRRRRQAVASPPPASAGETFDASKHPRDRSGRFANEEVVKTAMPLAEPLEKGLFRTIGLHTRDLIDRPTAVGKVPAFSQIKRSLVRANMLGRERVIAVDETGRVLHNVLGGRDEVSTPPDPEGSRSAVIYHNHPGRHTATPSLGDILSVRGQNFTGVVIAPRNKSIAHFSRSKVGVRRLGGATWRYGAHDLTTALRVNHHLLRPDHATAPPNPPIDPAEPLGKRASAAQKAKVKLVMHEWKTGKLRAFRGYNTRGGLRRGPVVSNQRQAIAIALRQSGMSKSAPATGARDHRVAAMARQAHHLLTRVGKHLGAGAVDPAVLSVMPEVHAMFDQPLLPLAQPISVSRHHRNDMVADASIPLATVLRKAGGLPLDHFLPKARVVNATSPS